MEEKIPIYTNEKRIFYVIFGEGMGHAMRSSVIINHLQKKNKVIIFSSGKAFDYLSKKYENVFSIEGFNLVLKNNCVKKKRTLLNAIKKFPRLFNKNIKILYKAVKAIKPNIIISDFEPFSNIISKLMNIPLISIDNMHIITNCAVNMPPRYYRSEISAKGVIRLFIMHPKKYLISTFFYLPITKRNTLLFPPILRDKILNLKPTVKNHILVYQLSDSNHRTIPILKQVNQKFIVYGLNKEKKEGNLHFRKFNEEHFFRELADAKAVITTGGFTLIGEALHLDKPILCVPIQKHFEQILNATYIQKLGYGEFHEDLNCKIIETFLSRLGQYRKNLENYKKEDNSRILKEIDSIINCYSKKYR